MFSKGYTPWNKKEPVKAVCSVCGTEYARRPSRMNRSRKPYCSRKCWHASPESAAVAIPHMKAGDPRLWRGGNGGACKGRKATEKQMIGLRIGWARKGPEKTESWRGGLTEKNWGFYRTAPYQEWRKAIIERDKKCVLCGSRKRLEADHIEPRALRPDLALDLSNGRALCHDCHVDTPTYRGRVNRIRNQMEKANVGPND